MCARLVQTRRTRAEQCVGGAQIERASDRVEAELAGAGQAAQLEQSDIAVGHAGDFGQAALRRANDKFTRRFTAIERSVADAGRTMKEMTSEELDERWRWAKED